MSGVRFPEAAIYLSYLIPFMNDMEEKKETAEQEETADGVETPATETPAEEAAEGGAEAPTAEAE